MQIKKINKDTFIEFSMNHDLTSFYQSIEWVETKNREYDILGLYHDENLVGASIILYLKTFRKYKIAYASRGFIYDYSNVSDFTIALKEYFKQDKSIIFFRMDPLIILSSYDKNLNKNTIEDSVKKIEELKKNGFKHFGFNTGYETTQFRFVHRLLLENSFDKQMESMSKSTKKNIKLAKDYGVKIERANTKKLDTVYELFEKSVERKNISNLRKSTYQSILEQFKDKAVMYLAYIDKSAYTSYLKIKLEEAHNEYNRVIHLMNKVNVGEKLKKQKETASNLISKYESELEESKSLEDITYIGSMISIFYKDEVVSLSSGMDFKYRKFCPKYAMYPAMIEDAINNNYKYVNFLGVKNILDKDDPAYGVYEVKRGFGGETLEYIGEFDLPLRNSLYKLYKIKENKERK